MLLTHPPFQGFITSITSLTGKQVFIWELGEDSTASNGAEVEQAWGEWDGPWRAPGTLVTMSFAFSFQPARACMELREKS